VRLVPGLHQRPEDADAGRPPGEELDDAEGDERLPGETFEGCDVQALGHGRGAPSHSRGRAFAHGVDRSMPGPRAQGTEVPRPWQADCRPARSGRDGRPGTRTPTLGSMRP